MHPVIGKLEAHVDFLQSAALCCDQQGESTLACAVAQILPQAAKT